VRSDLARFQQNIARLSRGIRLQSREIQALIDSGVDYTNERHEAEAGRPRGSAREAREIEKLVEESFNDLPPLFNGTVFYHRAQFEGVLVDKSFDIAGHAETHAGQSDSPTTITQAQPEGERKPNSSGGELLD
jgi:hypothetical protein